MDTNCYGEISTEESDEMRKGKEMITLTNPKQLPDGWMRGYAVDDEAEAERVAAGRVAYLYKSVNGLIVYVSE